VLPAALPGLDTLFSGAGGFAAAIAIGAFLGQAATSFVPSPDRKRRNAIAVGGLFGLLTMIGLIFLSANGW
jgi:hypothetical protein